MRTEAAALRAVGAPPAPLMIAAGETEHRAYIIMERLRGGAWSADSADLATFAAVCAALERVARRRVGFHDVEFSSRATRAKRANSLLAPRH